MILLPNKAIYLSLPENECDSLTEWLAEDSPTDCVDNEWAVLFTFKELSDCRIRVVLGSKVKPPVCSRVFADDENSVDWNIAVEPTLKSWDANVLSFVDPVVEGSIYSGDDVKT